MDPNDRRFVGDILMMLALLLFTVLLYARFATAGVLFAGSLALSVLVVGLIILSRRE